MVIYEGKAEEGGTACFLARSSTAWRDAPFARLENTVIAGKGRGER